MMLIRKKYLLLILQGKYFGKFCCLKEKLAYHEKFR